MIAISRGIPLSIVLCIAGCLAPAEQRDQPASDPPVVLDEKVSETQSCGVSPSSFDYWASAWQRDIKDFDGLVGGCVYDASCLPECWGTMTEWSSWNRPLIQCPCHAQ